MIVAITNDFDRGVMVLVALYSVMVNKGNIVCVRTTPRPFAYTLCKNSCVFYYDDSSAIVCGQVLKCPKLKRYNKQNT